MKSLKLGDLVIKDDVEKGFSIYKRHNGELKAWLNQKGELALLDWLAEKHGRTFESKMVTTEANRKGWKIYPTQGGKKKDNPPHVGEKEK